MTNEERKAIDLENDGLERAEDLGAHDAASNVASDPSRYGLVCLEASAYRRAYTAKVTELVRIEERKMAQPISEETAELIRQSLTIFTLGTVKQPIRFPGQRYQVRHYSRQNCVLNPEDSGFPDYDTAALERDHLLEAGLEVGDYVTIEDQGCIIELHEHKPNTEGESR